MDNWVIFPYFNRMLCHGGKSLIVGCALLTQFSFWAVAQSGSSSSTSSDDRLTLPSSRSQFQNDNKSYTDDKKYSFEKEISDLPPVFYEVRGARIFGSKNHSFQVEHHSVVPLLRAEDMDGLLFLYEHKDYTPFASDNGGSQVESVTNFDNMRVEYEFVEDFALKGLVGFDTYSKVDRIGAVGGYRAGIGIGSPYEDNMDDLTWEIVTGGLARSEALKSDWFVDADVRYRLVKLDFLKSKSNDEFNPSILLEVREQSTNDKAKIHYYVELGPTLEILSVNNNRFSIYAHYFRNSHNEFMMISDRGFMAGIQGTTFHDLPADYSYDWDFEGIRWIPRMWGRLDNAANFQGYIRKMNLYLDAWDVSIAGRVVSIYGDYEHRQDQISELSSTSFSVAAGGKTYIGPDEVGNWLGTITDGQHLEFFGQFFHRSDHALNVKDPNRLHPSVTSAGYLDRDGIDNLEAGFQTIGWNNPNYRTDKFQDDTKFVNEWDWMAKVGYAVTNKRSRSQPPASVGVNWDIASIAGFVIYTQGIFSTGQASPDYIAEVGVKRPGGCVFIRLENYGVPARLENDNKPIYAGLGLNL
jgi:hypothetical protein